MHKVRMNATGEGGGLTGKREPRRGASEASLSGFAIPRSEKRHCNQRREDRHLNVCESAEVKFRNRNCKVHVHNVSNNGAMIEADFAPRIGERIQISFEGCIRTDCTVRWVRGRKIGLEFFHETVIVAPAKVREMIVSGRRAGEMPTLDWAPDQDQAEAPASVPIPAPAPAPPAGGSQPAAARRTPAEPERSPRQNVLWRATLHWPRGSQPVRLRNISAEGAMLEGTDDLADDTSVFLDLGESGALSGRVRWSRAGQIGIRFDDRFDLTKLACAGAPSQAEPRPAPIQAQNENDPQSPWPGRWHTFNPQDLLS
jgi:hypothetical protein